MSRKLLITIIIGLIIILGALAWFFFSNNSSTAPENNTVATGLPFGQGGESVSFTDTTNTPREKSGLDPQGRPISKLFKVSNEPVAGFMAFNKNKVLTVRVVDRATGHIYDVDPTTLEKTQITNNTYPKIQEAYFKNDGSALLLRDIKTDSDSQENFALALTAPKSTTTDSLHMITLTNLNSNITSVSVGPNNSLVYALKEGGSIVTSLFDGSKGVNLFPSNFSDWVVSWPSANTINITTKATSGVTGYSYNLNTASAGLTKVLGPLEALTALESTDAKNIVYSYSEKGRTYFAYKNISTKTGGELLPTTFADKCAWSKKSSEIIYCGTPSTSIGQAEPENWYSGVAHYSDQIWRFNLQTNTSEVLVEPKKTFGVDLDLINLSLWALKLN